MESLFLDLCNFFGISGTPTNFEEFLPWFFTIVVALGMVVAVFNLIRAITLVLCRGKLF